MSCSHHESLASGFCPDCEQDVRIKMPATPTDAERALREAIEAALYWVSSSHGCECVKCEAKRQSVIQPINRAVRAAVQEMFETYDVLAIVTEHRDLADAMKAARDRLAPKEEGA